MKCEACEKDAIILVGGENKPLCRNHYLTFLRGVRQSTNPATGEPLHSKPFVTYIEDMMNREAK